MDYKSLYMGKTKMYIHYPWCKFNVLLPIAFVLNSDLLYAEKVYPTEVRIYETYHPGAVVQIFACELYMNQNGQMVNHDVR